MNRVVDAIDNAYAQEPEEKPRQYIGASSLGNECLAYQSFNMRGFPNTPARPNLKRIFQFGHALEDVVVADLKKAGFEVLEIDPDTGKQFKFSHCGGHVSGHTDGKIKVDGEWLMLEIKSMNKTSFAKFVNHGIAKSHPSYNVQMHTYMAVFDMDKALMVAICKDNSQYHAEVVEFTDDVWNPVEERVNKVLSGSCERISTRPEDFRCKMCFKKDVCWETKDEPPIPKTAATCKFGEPDQEKGGFFCDRCSTRGECCSEKEWRRFNSIHIDIGGLID